MMFDWKDCRTLSSSGQADVASESVPSLPRQCTADVLQFANSFIATETESLRLASGLLVD
jgi:hypothetical protein